MFTLPRNLQLPLVGIIAIGVCVLLAPIAHNATSAAPERFGPSTVGGPARSAPSNVTTGAWSGAVTTSSTSGTYSTVSSTWIEPSITCNSYKDIIAPWVGIDGLGNNTVEQTGVAAYCSYGYPVHQAWYEMYPANPVYYSYNSYPVSAGDTINASVSRSGSTYTLTLNDATKGWTKNTVQYGNNANSSAEVVTESNQKSYPAFSTVNFTNSKVNGYNLSAWQPTLYDAANAAGYVETRTSAVSGGNFSISYVHE